MSEAGAPKHTPTPWKSGGRVGYGHIRILAEQGPVTVCPATAHGEGDADFIVRACNAHDDLVEALGLARVQIEASNLYVNNNAIREGGDLVIAEIDAALTRARGVQS